MMSTSQAPAPDLPSLLETCSGYFDLAPWAVTEVSGESHVVRYANAAFCQLIDRSRDAVIGRPLDSFLPPFDACLTHLDRVFRTGVAASYTADEQTTPCPLLYSYSLWPVTADGRTAGVIIQVNETGPIHETRQAISQALLLGALRQDELIRAADLANARLQSEIRERMQRETDARLLANEIAHRVKNNLQIVVALISNEIRRTPAPCVHGYRAMQDRILAIAQLYDLISDTGRDRTVVLADYLKEISKSLSSSLLGGASGIRIVVEAEAMEIDAARAVPFGLLVNELTTNAVKHAFPDGNGLVTLSLRRLGDEVELMVTDDGIGMTIRDTDRLSEKHGSDYVTIFVRQLHGTLVRTGAPGVGTSHRIVFPLAPESGTDPRL